MPSAFISYSWDSPEHKDWVQRFATDLRAGGVDAWLDRWEVRLGDDVTEFMEKGISQADFVLLVCTDAFAGKANRRQGGVGYEQAIVTADLLNGHPPRGRFVCVLRGGTPSSALPVYMQSRLFVDFRDNAGYAEGLRQILIHLFDRYDEQRPPLAATTAVPDRSTVNPVLAETSLCWVLVAGTGVERAFTPELKALSTVLGERLMNERCGLITGGWPGVDEWVARGFVERGIELDRPLEDLLIQVIRKSRPLAFTAGQVVFVETDDEEWNEPIRRADVVLLLGGVGGTWKTGEIALRNHKPVLPVAGSGWDAESFFAEMLRNWEKLSWLDITQREFAQLGRPGRSGIEAGVQLAIEIGRKTRQ